MKRMEFIGIIPARYASTRFPAKPLAILGGKTVIQRVYEQVSSVLDNVCVATDDDRIHEAVEAFGGRVVMTSANHKSGTDRICEAYNKLYPNTSSPLTGGRLRGGDLWSGRVRRCLPPSSSTFKAMSLLSSRHRFKR